MIFFQSISVPLTFNGKDTTLADGALHRDLAAENIHHPLHQRKAEAVALGGMGGIPLIKLLKDMVSHLRRHAAAIVLKDEGNEILFMADGNLNLRQARTGRNRILGNIQDIVRQFTHHSCLLY